MNLMMSTRKAVLMIQAAAVIKVARRVCRMHLLRVEEVRTSLRHKERILFLKRLWKRSHRKMIIGSPALSLCLLLPCYKMASMRGEMLILKGIKAMWS